MFLNKKLSELLHYFVESFVEYRLLMRARLSHIDAKIDALKKSMGIITDRLGIDIKFDILTVDGNSEVVSFQVSNIDKRKSAKSKKTSNAKTGVRARNA